MAKSEYEGVCFTAGLDKDGWLISVTERAGSSAEAYANLEATKQLMIGDGVKPFISYYNKAEAVVGAPKDVIAPENFPVPAPDFTKTEEIDFTPTTVVQEAVQELGAVLAGAVIEDGTHYLGIKTTKPKVAECLQGNSYEIVVDSYERKEDKIEFYNEHSQYPACTHSLKGKGGTTFQEIFPNWNPAIGAGKISPLKLYIVGKARLIRATHGRT